MPVATSAAVKTLSPAEVESAGVEILIANAYHLFLRPGADIVAKAGGLHHFMGWSRPIVTDSGGFQIFSLSGTRVCGDGVVFTSHLDGSRHLLTPEDSMRIQELLGADIAMAFDYCPRNWNDPDEIAESTTTTIRWAERCRRAHRGRQQTLFGIIQGGTCPDFRQTCIHALEEIGFPGYGIGGLSIGEPFEETLATVRLCVDLLPESRVRYVMGVGEPVQMLSLIAEGIDLFDCGMPTRIARHGTALTSRGRITIRNGQYKDDRRPLDPGCSCAVCTGWTRAYLRHLFNAGEMLGPRLISLHNLVFVARLLERAREAISEGRFAALKSSFETEYNTGLDTTV